LGFNVEKHSRKWFQVNELENGWRGFLVDADAVTALPFLNGAIKATAHDDREIVKEAWDDSRTIVTSNGWDFVRYIREFQNPPNNPRCRDPWGLLVIPNPEFNRENGLKSIQHGLEVLKGEKLRWPGAALLNLWVRLSADGQPEIHRFKRCSFCEHPECGVPINEPWNTWYRSLPDPPRRSIPTGSRNFGLVTCPAKVYQPALEILAL
jgi:hypothetical protein